jgi:L-rhamnose-H+ transport protein
MQSIVGIIFHFIGGFASGSFYMPFKKVKGWHWESYWLVGGLFSWLIEIIEPFSVNESKPIFDNLISSIIIFSFL